MHNMEKNIIFSRLGHIKRADFSTFFIQELFFQNYIFRLSVVILAALIFGIYVIRTCIQKIKDRKRNGIVVPMILKPSSQFNNKYWNPEIVTTKNMYVCIIGLLSLSILHLFRTYILDHDIVFYRVILSDLLSPFCFSFILPLLMYLNNSSLRRFFIESLQ